MIDVIIQCIKQMMVSSFDQEAYYDWKDDWIMIEFLPICVYGMPKM